jgi:hypothetical protein
MRIVKAKKLPYKMEKHPLGKMQQVSSSIYSRKVSQLNIPSERKHKVCTEKECTK